MARILPAARQDWGNKDEYGGSIAGYMSCWLATQTDRLRPLRRASVTNLLSDYGTSDITLPMSGNTAASPGRMPGTCWTTALAHVENVRLPSSLHRRPALPIGQTANSIAPKRLGKEVVMVRYPDEFHSPFPLCTRLIAPAPALLA